MAVRAQRARQGTQLPALCLHRVLLASTAFLSQSTQHGVRMLISVKVCAHACLQGQPQHDAQRFTPQKELLIVCSLADITAPSWVSEMWRLLRRE